MLTQGLRELRDMALLCAQANCLWAHTSSQSEERLLSCQRVTRAAGEIRCCDRTTLRLSSSQDHLWFPSSVVKELCPRSRRVTAGEELEAKAKALEQKQWGQVTWEVTNAARGPFLRGLLWVAVNWGVREKTPSHLPSFHSGPQRKQFTQGSHLEHFPRQLGFRVYVSFMPLQTLQNFL